MKSNLALRLAMLAASSLVGALAGCGERQQQELGRAPLAGAMAQAQLAQALSPAAANPGDLDLMSRIKAAYAKEPLLQFQAIQVRAIDGVAILSGAVNSEANSQKAEEVASSIEGVRSVENRLLIGSLV